MKKLLLSSALLLCCTTGFAQDKAVKADIYGFVRNYFTYDSRSCVQSNEGLFNMLPNDHKYGADGEDLNAIPSVRFLSITTRFGVNVSGPEIWGAKSSAKFESDFCGASSSSAFNLRIRQAYAKLAWEKHDLLVGQAWHPISGDLMPEVFSLATGAPFNPFNRSPQVRYNYTPVKGLTLTAAALYQFQYGSVGLDGKTSNVYSRNAMVPELFVGMTGKGKYLSGGFGVNASTIAPRVTAETTEGTIRVHESLTSYSAIVFGSLKVDDLSIRAKAMYGQNTSHMQQPTGFGIVGHRNNGYAPNGYLAANVVNEYDPMQLGSAWLTMMYGKKVRYGFFAGWMKNFGTADMEYISTPVVRNNTGMDQAYRFSPIVTYKVQNMTLGLEYEHTATAYGEYKQSAGVGRVTDGTIINTHWVANNRVCFMLKYDF